LTHRGRCLGSDGHRSCLSNDPRDRSRRG
jgi:hypothetical protein